MTFKPRPQGSVASHLILLEPSCHVKKLSLASKREKPSCPSLAQHAHHQSVECSHVSESRKEQEKSCPISPQIHEK